MTRNRRANNNSPRPKHLPMTRDEMDTRGWSALDVLLISGDAYYDHPAHGVAVIGRVLEQAGYRVGIIARPDWKNSDTFKVMGRPELFVGIGAGAVDSTLNNYTADLAPRKKDAYAPKDDPFGRPNFATAVYSGAAKAAFPGISIIIGGIEASTRRFAYFDYLKKRVRRSILVDTRADALVFGPGEKQIVEIAGRLALNKDLGGIDGTAILTRTVPDRQKYNALPAFDEIENNIAELITQTSLLETGMGPEKQERFFQQYQEGVIICEPPVYQDAGELDAIYNLEFSRDAHPAYKTAIPALETVKWSVTADRGCPGGCSFCAISIHQGRKVGSRSEQSILAEIERIVKHPEFRGTITDVGGPTANCYQITIKDPGRCKKCRRPSCMHPKICSNLNDGQSLFIQLLSEARELKGVKHLFVASGIRHDLALRNVEFIKVLAKYYTGGHLKVAPEHSDNNTLKLMRKPPIEVMDEFEQLFKKQSHKVGKEQYLVPYFISGFPGCTKHAGDNAGQWLRSRNHNLEQVQNFIPLPGTMAAAMYAAKQDTKGNPLYIPDAQERKRQKRLLTGGNHRRKY